MTNSAPFRFPQAYQPDFTHRETADPGTDRLFVERWSVRSYRKQALSFEHKRALIDAARWAPSSSNIQPWRIVTNRDDTDFGAFLDLLVPGNQAWAAQASWLGFFVSALLQGKDGKPNTVAAFDTGAAWMSLALQAHMMGLSAHGMGGFDADRVYERFGIDRQRFAVQCAFAVGVPDTPDKLPEGTRAREIPSSRGSVEDIWSQGVGFPFSG